ncbi:MAG TPA: FRG domain-containing protein [Chitinophagaceae bacterium]|nr:FRG domain-containing protein [Chitinophagaceae bacterium]
MAKLNSFKTLDEKKAVFAETRYFQIDTKKQFDQWFKVYTSEIKQSKKTDFIYRGMGEAAHKLYTSAQRLWIQNDMEEWAPNGFLGFIDDMIQKAKRYPLIEKVFDIYGYNDDKREFPILSILQHYWAPTPLMDWTYNINVALFFATENLTGGNGRGDLSDYFSVYRINKSKYRNELSNIRQHAHNEAINFKSFSDWGDNGDKGNSILYISDFDEGNAFGAVPGAQIRMIDGDPFTSIYNQNIIPQEGLFIFNPYSKKTIDEIFNVKLDEDNWNLELTPFSCFNIKKDLCDYVRRHIKEQYEINKSFIYPNLYDDAQTIKNSVLNQYAE